MQTEKKEFAVATAAATAAAAEAALTKLAKKESSKTRNALKFLVLLGSVSLGTVLLFKYYKPSFHHFRIEV